jgi:hypothetical protein
VEVNLTPKTKEKKRKENSFKTCVRGREEDGGGGGGNRESMLVEMSV